MVKKIGGRARPRGGMLGKITRVEVDAHQALPAVLPLWRGKFVGQGVRVPTPIVHLAVLNLAIKKTTTVSKVNGLLRAVVKSKNLAGLLAVTDEPVVSQDFRATTVAATVDLGMTQVAGKLVQIAAWYDNEWAFAVRLVDLLQVLAKRG